MTNIPNKINGDVLYATELFKIIASDNTGGSVNNTVVETVLSTQTISANQVGTGIIVLASVRYGGRDSTAGGNTTCVFNLKIGPTGSPTTKKSLTLWTGDHGVGTPLNGGGALLMYYDNSQTWSAGVDVDVTATMSTAVALLDAYVDSVIVIGV